MTFRYRFNSKLIFSRTVWFYFLLLHSLLLCFNLNASNWRVERIDTKQGLSHMTVDDMLQDQQGFIWIATPDGLNRYDGYQFKIYRNRFDDPYSLSDNRVLDLHEDSSGVLWVATAGGLNRFDPVLDRFERFVHQPDNPNSIYGDIVSSIAEDKLGHLWLSSYQAGISRFDIQARVFTRYQHQLSELDGPSSNKIMHISFDQSGKLWLSTSDQGISRFDPLSEQFENFNHDPDDPGSLGGNFSKYISHNPDGSIWISILDQGLYQFEPEDASFSRVELTAPNITPTQVFTDAQGHRWIGSVRNGVYRIEASQRSVVQYRYLPMDPTSISSDYVKTIMQDHSGIIWFGTQGGGLSRFNPSMTRFKHFTQADGLAHNSVWQMMEDRSGYIWIGSTAKGVNRFDYIKNEFLHFGHYPEQQNSIQDDLVLSVFEDHSGMLWFGYNASGISAFDPSRGLFRHFRHDEKDAESLVADLRVVSFAEDFEDNLWIATGGGLSRLDKQRRRFEHFLPESTDNTSIGSKLIQTLLVDKQGDLWVGHYNQGLDKLVKGTREFTHFRHDPKQADSLSSNTVLSVLQSRDGVLWVGTSSGLNRYDPQSNGFKHYRRHQGLSNDVVLGIVEDKLGFLWLTTNNGLNRFDPQQETFERYFYTDGIQNNEFSTGAYGITRSGLVFVGGINGFNLFNPADIQANSVAPKVVFTDFLLNNHSVELSSNKVLNKNINYSHEIKLAHTDNVFTFEFAALDFINPLKNQYKYQLQGFDQQWLDADAKYRRATYTNLDSGEYYFRVKASNVDNVWNDSPKSIKITVLPSPWHTNLAYSIYSAILMMVLTILLVMRYKKVKADAEAAAAIAASEKQLTLALWGSGEQLWDWDLERGNIERKNVLANFDLPKCQAVELLTAKLLLIHPDDQHIFDVDLSKHQSGHSDYFECRYRMKDRDGNWRWVLDRGKIVKFDQYGHALRMTGTLQDVHDAYLVEESLRELNETLERKVLERTQELQTSLDQLTVAQKHIVEAEKMASLGTLVAGVAHEVNTPLGICITMNSALQQRVISINDKFNQGKISRKVLEQFIAELAQGQEIVENNLLRSAELVQSFKQVAVDQSEDNRVDLVLADYLRDIIRTMRSRMLNKQIEINLEVDDDWIINTYPSAWWQLMTNLIENSIAHGFFGQGAGNISIAVSLDNANNLDLVYRDNGNGIDEQHLAAIFDPFYTTARNREHIGLGLHIVYNIVVQKFGGSIDCDSHPNQGTSFHIKMSVG